MQSFDQFSSSLFEPLGAQQIVFPDLDTITNLTRSSAAASRKRKVNQNAGAGLNLGDDDVAALLAGIDPANFPNAANIKVEPLDGANNGAPPAKRQDSSDDHAEAAGQKKKPGRKLAQTEPTNKRTAQNRAAQRAFRERKERYVRDLEARVEELENASKGGAASAPAAPSKDMMEVEHENKKLKQRVSELESENSILREMTFSFDFPASSVPNAPGSVIIPAANSTTSPLAPSLASPAAFGSTTPLTTPFTTPAFFPQTPQVPPPVTNVGGMLNASPDDLFAIFDTPFVGLPDDLSFGLPDFPSPAPTATSSVTANANAQQRKPDFTTMRGGVDNTNLFDDIDTKPASAIQAKNPVFDMNAFLNSSPSPDPDLDVFLSAANNTSHFSDPVAASSAAAVAAAANGALLTSFGLPAHLRERITKEIPQDLPAVCCENQDASTIDELCEIFKTKAQCTEMQSLQNKILEACNSGDRDRVMDLVDVCKEKKRMYLLRLKAGVTALPKYNP
ncbi:DNA-binding transcription factor yap1 [Irineochytrium annulatum]|nr:DNA-binding transcription factor yap1 [Irineochytrium annulatum]